MGRKRARRIREEKEKKKLININEETKHGVIAIILFALAMIFILSFQETGGVAGEYLFKGSKLLFGNCLWLVPIILVAAGIAIIKELHKNVYLSTLLGMLIFVVSFLSLIHILFPNADLKAGWVGYIVSWPFLKLIGKWASLVVFVAGIVISILVAFDISFKKTKEEKEKEKEELIKEKISKEIKGVGFESAEKKVTNLVRGLFSKPKFNVKELEGSAATPTESEKQAGGEELLQTTATFIQDYTFPPLDLLESDKGVPASGDIKLNMNIIERTLENFGIPVEMGEVNVGPTVTQYTLRPAGGVKLSKITALQRDISLALAAHPIRIEAPIPGRSLVGIEIPNKVATLVRLRNMLEEYNYRKDGHNLNFALGRDVSGQIIWANLVKMPHLLIAGATGTGKSICINAIITSLLYQKSPWELKFILIDPKRVELPLYNGIPHLLTPVIVDIQRTISAFKWAIREMEERYKHLASVGARDLATYNEKIVKKSPQETLPYIVIIIDELADIMAAHGKEVEGTIVRLAQMARATGIHLILSTQRPSVEVITGLIKANITSRIAFQVASQVDSRTILDMASAEKLLGNGDMLFQAGDVAKPKRIQGVYISEREIKNVVKFLRKEAGEIEYEEEITKAP
ncbi:MAG: DNA segregation ATPase FtsK/SpoIIIE, S-DNA-T family, partial [Parcubacteria group bacterium Athens0714_24]